MPAILEEIPHINTNPTKSEPVFVTQTEKAWFDSSEIDSHGTVVKSKATDMAFLRKELDGLQRTIVDSQSRANICWIPTHPSSPSSPTGHAEHSCEKMHDNILPSRSGTYSNNRGPGPVLQTYGA